MQTDPGEGEGGEKQHGHINWAINSPQELLLQRGPCEVKYGKWVQIKCNILTSCPSWNWNIFVCGGVPQTDSHWLIQFRNIPNVLHHLNLNSLSIFVWMCLSVLLGGWVCTYIKKGILAAKLSVLLQCPGLSSVLCRLFLKHSLQQAKRVQSRWTGIINFWSDKSGQRT